MPELECYDAMLTRLFKQELEQIVMGYEAYRLNLNHEVERRGPEESKIAHKIETKVRMLLDYG